MKYLYSTVGGSSQATEDAAQSSPWSQFHRFLQIGDQDGTYYVQPRKFTPAHASAVAECLRDDGVRVVTAITDFAQSGRAPRIDPLLFALAMAASPDYTDPVANAAALQALPAVARTAAHLLKFAAAVNNLRGWGRGLRSAIARWYVEKPPRELARQMLKQRDRAPFAHADLLRLAHPRPASDIQNLLFRWTVEGELRQVPEELRQIYGFEQARKANDRREIVSLIEEYRLTHEMIPSQWLDSPDVWEALLDNLPYCAMLRYLGKLTTIGLIAAQGAATALVAARLVDRRRIARAKAHPVTLLTALLKYRTEGGVPAITAAIEEALYLSFENVQPAGRPYRLTMTPSAPLASAALAMLAARTEKEATTVPAIAHTDRVDRVLNLLQSADAGPAVTLQVDGRLSVRIAPQPSPGDPGVLQIAGFDATVPPVIANWLSPAC